ncbi:MAG: hypothetical protein ABR591_16475, partial [Candidatus Velthaea sp.]
LSAHLADALEDVVPQVAVPVLVLYGNADRLCTEAWARRLAQLSPDGRFVTTQLVVRTAFLKDHPDAVRRLVQGQVQANEFVNTNPDEAQRLVNQAITALTGKGLAAGVLQAAWKNMEFTNDPIATSLAVSADHAHEVGLLDKVSLKGVYDLTLLNQVLTTSDRPEVAG